LRATVAKVFSDFDEVVEMALDNSLLLDRLHGTGYLRKQTARDMQVTGLAARASGIDTDARRDHPTGAYANLHMRVPVFSSGDVWARFMVRVEEIDVSRNLISAALDASSPGELCNPIESLPPDAGAFGLVEG